jgi:hypothetical protein
MDGEGWVGERLRDKLVISRRSGLAKLYGMRIEATRRSSAYAENNKHIQ